MKRLTIYFDNRLDPAEAEQISRVTLIFNLVSIGFLSFFAFHSLRDQNFSYGMILLGIMVFVMGNTFLFLLTGRMKPFVLITCFGYLIFCIFVQTNGGQDTTGLQWHFVYPAMVFYLAGLRMGSICAVTLIIIEIIFMTVDPGLLSTAQYSPDFKLRFIATMIVMSSFGALLEHSREKAQRTISNMAKTFQLASQTDELTGLANRRALKEKLENEAVRAERLKNDFTIVMCDIDFFKRINDRYGHAVGDLALKHLAFQFQKVLRKYDMASRWGGEEFLLIMPNTDLHQGVIISERIRAEVEKTPFQNDSGETIRLTVSCGVSNWNAHPNTNELIRIADDRLYRAKHEGRNRVVWEN